MPQSSEAGRNREMKGFAARPAVSKRVTGGPHPDEELVVPWDRGLDIFDVEQLGRPVTVMDDGSHRPR